MRGTLEPALRFLARALPAGTAALLALAPRAAEACAVCFSGRTDETRIAFIASTAAMTLLPLGLVGGGVLWLRRRLRADELEQEAHRARKGGGERDEGPAAARL